MAEQLAKPDWIPEDNLRRLNPVSIDDRHEIERLLERIHRERLELQRGTNQHAVPERARLESLSPETLVLSVRDFDRAERDQIFLNVAVGGVRYFFSSERVEQTRDRLELRWPAVVYRAERRDRRRSRAAAAGSQRSVELRFSDGQPVRGRQVDSSEDGLGVEAPEDARLAPGAALTVDFVDGPSEPAVRTEIRNTSDADAPGWRRVGLVRAFREAGTELAVLRSTEAAVPSAEAKEELPGVRSTQFVSIRDGRGESIKAIVDVAGEARGATAVIIPPAWGRTKESTLALAETVLHTFAAADEPVVVVRFDGIRRRGEGSNDPGCEAPAGENRHYTFSQGVRDVHSVIDFLQSAEEYAPAKVLLATFSIAAVEGRRAIASDPERRVGGWVSIVGASDPQSMIRVVSGGVDYFAGAAEGLRFGEQYIQGLLLDVDAAADDAIRHGLAFLGDARRDMSEIDVPVTWIYGLDDAWTRVERVRDMLSVGDASKRRLIEAPTGHQLRTSEQALETFALAASELARIALGRSVQAVKPPPDLVRKRRRDERRRLRAAEVDLKGFWRDYLVGRDGRLGIELVSSTTAYRSLMALQIDSLELSAGESVVDLGSGTGALPVELSGKRDLHDLSVIAVDLITDGLKRARLRVDQGWGSGHAFAFLAANLDRGVGGGGIPLQDASADAVLASLLLNYLRDPTALLQEVARVLRPGGRFALSGMRPDADISKICVSGVAEIRSGEAQAVWAADGVESLDKSLQEFISSGARLLDLEEADNFHFWEPAEVEELVRGAGLEVTEVRHGYGDPPQAFVVVARKPVEGGG